MLYSFNSRLKSYYSTANNKLTYAIALGLCSWAHAVDYALVRTNAAGETPLIVDYAQNLAQLNSPYSLVRIQVPPVIATGNVSLLSLVASDKLFVSTSVSNFNTLFPSSSQDLTVSAQFSLSGDMNFNPALEISSGSSVDFILNGRQLLIQSSAVLSGAGTLSFQEGSAAGNIIMNGSVAGLTGSLNLNGANTLTLQNDLTFAGVLSGTGTIIKSPAGTTIFSNANNNFSGTIELRAGTLQFTSSTGVGVGLLMSDSTIFTQQSTPLTLKSLNTVNPNPVSARPIINMRTLIIDNPTKNIFGGQFGGPQALRLTKQGAGELVLNATSNHAAPTIISAGKITFGADNALGNGSISIGAAGSLDLAGYTLAAGTDDLFNLQGGVFLNSNSAISATNNKHLSVSTHSSIIQADGDIIQNGRLTMGGNLTKNGVGRFIVKGVMDSATTGLYLNAGTFVIDNTTIDATTGLVFSGVGSVEKKGTNKLTLTGTSPDFTGNFIISDGTIAVGKQHINPSSSQAFGASISGPGTFEKINSNTVTMTGNLSGHTGQLILKEGTLTLGSNGADQQIASDMQSLAGTQLIKEGSNKVVLTNDLGALNSSTTIRVSSGTLAVGNNNSDYILRSYINGSAATTPTFGTFEKIGSNKVTLESNLSQFKGVMKVTDGTLAFNSTFPSTHAVLFSMSGSGTVQKLGSRTVVFYGDLGQFNGDIILSEGVMGINNQTTVTTNYNVLSSKISGPGGLELSASTKPLTLSGDLSAHSGSFIVNHYNLSIGNDIADYTLSSSLFGAGGLFKSGTNNITFAGDLSNYTGSLQVNQGRMSLASSATLRSGQIINVFGGELELQPGATAQAIQIRSGAKTLLQRNSSENGMLMSSVDIFSGGLLDIDVPKNGMANTAMITIGALTLNAKGLLFVRPDLTSSIDDLPLLNITAGLTLPNSNTGTNLTVLPQGTTPLASPISMKLLKLDGALNTQTYQNALLNILTVTPDYKIVNPSFSTDGVLSYELHPVASDAAIVLGTWQNIDLFGQTLTNPSITLAGGRLGNSTTEATYSGPVTVTASSSFGGVGNIRLIGDFSHATPGAVLTKIGPGEVIFTGSSNTITSQIDINDGFLSFVIDEGITQTVTGLLNQSASIAPYGGIKKLGLGTLIIGGSGNNGYRGETQITEGRMVLAKNLAISQGKLTISGGTLDSAGHYFTAPGGVELSGGVLENSSSTRVDIYSDVFITQNSTIQTQGTLYIEDLFNNTSGVVLTKAGPGDMWLNKLGLNNSDSYIDISEGNLYFSLFPFQNTCSATLTGSGGLKKSGFSLTLSGSRPNTYSGPTEIIDRTLQLGKNQALGTGIVKLSGSTSVLEMAGYTLNNSQILWEAGTLKNTSNNRVSYAGALTVSKNATMSKIDCTGSLKLQNSSFFVDPGFTSTNLHIDASSLFNIDFSALAGSQAPVVINNLHMESGAGIVLKPNNTATLAYAPMLRITDSILLDSSTASSFVYVGAQNLGATYDSIALNLLKLEGTLNNDTEKAKILGLLRPNTEYDVVNPVFDADGLLTVELLHPLNTPNLVLGVLRGFDIAGRPLTNTSINLAGGTLTNSTTAVTYQGPLGVTASSTIGGAGKITVSGNFTHNTSGALLTKTGAGELVIAGAVNDIASPIDMTQGWLTFDVTDGSSQSVSATLSSTTGTGGLKKTGAGQLILTGSVANTYTGATQIENGAVVLDKDYALGSGAVTLTGGSLDMAGHLLNNSQISLQGGALANTGARLSYQGAIQVKSASTLSNIDSTGTTTVQAARLKVDPAFQANNLTIAANGIVEVDFTDGAPITTSVRVATLNIQSGGSLLLQPYRATIDQNLPLLKLSSGVTLATTPQQATINVAIQGALTSEITTVPVLQLEGILNTPTNRNNILAALRAPNDYALVSKSFNTTSGILSCDLQYLLADADLVLGTGKSLDMLGRTLTNNSILLSGGTLTNSTTEGIFNGPLSVTANSTLGGAGNIRVGGAFVHNTAGAVLTKSGAGELILAGHSSLASTIAITGGLVHFEVGSGLQNSITSTLGSSGGVKKSGAGQLTIGGASSNTYIGTTQLTDGQVVLGKNSALGRGVLTISGGALDTRAYTLNNSQMVLAGGSLENNSSNAATYGLDVAVNSNSTIAGSGNITLSGNITHTTAGVVLTKAGAGDLVLSGSFNNITSAIDITNGRLELHTAVDRVFSATLLGTTAGGGLKKSGSGKITLTGSSPNTYNGTTQIAAGTLELGKNDALGSGVVTLSGTSILELAGYTLSNSQILWEGGSLQNTGNRVSYAGDLIMRTTGALSKIDCAGTLSLQSASLLVDAGFECANLNIEANSLLNIDFSALTGPRPSVVVQALNIQSGGGVVLRPHTTATLADSPLLRITNSLTSPAETEGTFIAVGLQNTGTPLEPLTVNLLKLDGALNNETEQSKILELLRANSEYDIVNPTFDENGLLRIGLQHFSSSPNMLVGLERNLDLAGRPVSNASIQLDGGSLTNSSTDVTYQGPLSVTATSSIGGAGKITVNGTLTHNSPGASLRKVGAGELVFAGGQNDISSDIDVIEGWLNFDLMAETNQIVSATLSSTSGSGGLKKNGQGQLTLSGDSANTYTGPTQIVNGRVVLGKNHALGSGIVTLSGGALNLAGYLLNNPQLSLEGGLLENSGERVSYQGALNVSSSSSIENIDVTGTINIQSARLKVDTGFQGNHLQIGLNGIFDIDFSPDVPSRGPVQIAHLNLQAGGGIVVNPHAAHMSADLPMLKITNSAILATRAESAYISVGLQEMTPSLTPYTLKLLHLEGALNTEENRTKLLDLLQESGDYEIVNSSFDEYGLLSCQMRHYLDNPDLLVGSGNTIDIAGRALINNTITLAGGAFNNSGADLSYEGAFYVTSSSLIGGTGNMKLQGPLSHNLPNIALKKEGSGALTIASSMAELTSDIDIAEGVVIFDVASGAQERLESRLISTTGVGAIKKMGAGELTLAGTGDNNYAGPTEILHGRVILAKNHGLGVGTLTLTGGSLDIAGYALSNTEVQLTGGSLENSGARRSYQGHLIVTASTVLTGLNSAGVVTVQGAVLKVDSAFHGANVQIENDGILELEKNLSQQNIITEVGSLTLASGGKIVLRPDLTSTPTEVPILRVQDSISLAQADAQTFISIEPLAMQRPPLRHRVNLLSLGNALNHSANKEAILALLQTQPDFQIEEALFSELGVLSCILKSNLRQPRTEAEAFAQAPSVYKALIQKIFAQQSGDQQAVGLLYEQAAYAESPEALLKHLRAFSPAGALPTALYQPVTKTHPTYLVQAHRQQSFLSHLQSKFLQQAREDGRLPHPIVNKFFDMEVLQSQRYQKYAEIPAGIDIQSFRHINLDGLSFESQLQYQTQKEPNRSDEEIGYSSRSWVASMSASFSKKNHYSIGSLFSTTKTHEKMNPNQLEKTGDKSDRLNTFGFMGYYQSSSVPIVFSGLITYGQHNYHQNRTWGQSIANSTELIEISANAQYKAYETTMQSEVGYIAYKDEKILMIQPFVGMTWSRTKNSAYEEQAIIMSTGESTDYGYIVPAQSYSARLYSLGVEFAGVRNINDTESLFFGRIGISTQKNTEESSTFRYAIASAPEASLEMSYQNYRYNTADILVGVNTTLTTGFELMVVYEANIGKALKSHKASLSIEYLF